jgi:hypothetical protein
MNCERCNHEFPSEYYFDYDVVPGAQICKDCVKSFSPAQIKAFREERQQQKLVRPLPDGTYVLPPRCCSCMGEAETTEVDWKTSSAWGATRTFSIKVPICAGCARTNRITEYFVVIIGTAVGIAIGAATGGWGGAIVAGILGFYGGVFVMGLIKSSTQPASIDSEGRLAFRNPKYQALFKSANSR